MGGIVMVAQKMAPWYANESFKRGERARVAAAQAAQTPDA